MPKKRFWVSTWFFSLQTYFRFLASRGGWQFAVTVAVAVMVVVTVAVTVKERVTQALSW